MAEPEAPDNLFRGLLPASILRDSYLKNSIYASLNRGARNSVDMAGNGLIRHSTVAFTCSQQTFQITDPRLASTMSRKALPLWTSGTRRHRGHIELPA